MRVFFIADSVSLPCGMAPTQRLSALARGVKDAGAEVKIILTRPTKPNTQTVNDAPRGKIFGIPFCYTSGASISAATRLGRRWQRWVGLVGALRMLGCEIRRTDMPRSDIRVITYSRHLSTICPVSLLCHCFKVPIVAEMCEWPVTQSASTALIRWRKYFFCRWVALFIDGAIPISRYIEEQIHAQARRLGKHLRLLYVPILVDTEEAYDEPLASCFHEPYILFGGSAAYHKTINFILDAFALLAGTYPELKLVITGTTSIQHTWISDAVERRGVSGRVIFSGFIRREVLMTAYRHAAALLTPLFSDAQSRARFPTKLAEYFMSGRPVITNKVGEIIRFLENGKGAFLAEPDSPELFSALIRYVIEHPEEASQAAIIGRRIAEENFDYRIHGRRLVEWLSNFKS